MGKEGKPDAAQQGGEQAEKIRIGEKEYSQEDVNNLLQTASSSSRSLEEAKPVLEMCRQYGITPDILAQQANSAFSIVSDLISQGIIDEEGKIKGGKAEKVNEVAPPGKPTETSSGSPLGNQNKADAVAEAALNPILDKLKGIEERIQAIDSAQAQMIRQDVKGRLKGSFPNLEEEDIELVLTQSLNQRGANLFDLAKARSEGKASKEDSLRRTLAQEWGVDLEKINQQKTLDGPGGAAKLFSGKKFSFLKKGADSVSPRQAAADYLRQVSMEE